MNIEELYREIDEMLPVQRSEDNFAADMEHALTRYAGLLNSLDEVITFNLKDWEKLKDRIMGLIAGINKSIDDYYRGMRADAYLAII